jgi:hypothetical protein
MTFAQQILVECLASADALHEPIRNPHIDSWAATWVLRKRYPRQGLPWRAGGDKERERNLTELVQDGFVKRRRAQRKTIAVMLTFSGLAEAWRLIGVGPDDAHGVLREVNRLGPNRRWVAEIKFSGGYGWGDDRQQVLKLVQTSHAPALTAQWVESSCDTHGRVGYRVTALGLDVLVKSALSPSGNGRADHVAEPPEPNDDAIKAYAAAYAEMIVWLDAQTNILVDARGEIGAIPLSASIW